jgi:hypothetical protein
LEDPPLAETGGKNHGDSTHGIQNLRQIPTKPSNAKCLN